MRTGNYSYLQCPFGSQRCTGLGEGGATKFPNDDDSRVLPGADLRDSSFLFFSSSLLSLSVFLLRCEGAGVIVVIKALPASWHDSFRSAQTRSTLIEKKQARRKPRSG